MDRRLLFPAVAATAWAQQTSPAAAKAEQALRERVQRFYQLQQDKKYREAEAMVADDTKDLYYNAKKAKIESFTIDRVDLTDNMTKAKVLIKAKILTLLPGAGAEIFEMPTTTTWKVENGEWRWYVSAEARSATPFGKMNSSEGGAAPGQLDARGAAPGGVDNPNVAALQGRISIDTTSVQLTRHKRDQVVTITNGLPGSLDLKLDPLAEKTPGLTVKIDKPHLDAGEKAMVEFHLYGEQKLSGIVEIVALPLNRVFDIQVTAQ